MALPTCECVAGQFIGDQWSSIYAAARAWADATMLPTPECVSGTTIKDKMVFTYCAFTKLTGNLIEV